MGRSAPTFFTFRGDSSCGGWSCLAVACVSTHTMGTRSSARRARMRGPLSSQYRFQCRSSPSITPRWVRSSIWYSRSRTRSRSSSVTVSVICFCASAALERVPLVGGCRLLGSSGSRAFNLSGLPSPAGESLPAASGLGLGFPPLTWATAAAMLACCWASSRAALASRSSFSFLRRSSSSCLSRRCRQRSSSPRFLRFSRSPSTPCRIMLVSISAAATLFSSAPRSPSASSPYSRTPSRWPSWTWSSKPPRRHRSPLCSLAGCPVLSRYRGLTQDPLGMSSSGGLRQYVWHSALVSSQMRRCL
mmetsp:Transcript_18627/g.56238  ORF Transcript_18627/g.56238 Transcript_18627/m.56238 type:complete len:303 (+) Transcript_18627:1744-2652(+)